MWIAMVAAVASAAPLNPTRCDPNRHTAPADAAGYCLDEAGYLEIAKLRIRVGELEGTVEARDREIAVQERAWTSEQERHGEELRRVQNEATARLSALETASLADIAVARKRTFAERHGFAAGIVTGTIGTVVLTAIVLDVYGDRIQ